VVNVLLPTRSFEVFRRMRGGGIEQHRAQLRHSIENAWPDPAPNIENQDHPINMQRV
jgi:hypothetical protein